MNTSYLTDEDAFIEHLRLSDDRKWTEKYFNLIEEVITITSLSSDNPRIVTSVARSNAYLPVTINNRYVLASFRQSYDAVIICQRQFLDRLDLHTGVSYYFKQLSGEKAEHDIPPILVVIDNNLSIPQELKESLYGWKRTLLIETGRAKSSPYKRYHNPYVYKAAVDKTYRKIIFDLVFE